MRLADANNKKAIESQLSEISSEWRELVSGLEGRRDALEALSRHWEDLEAQWALIETRLNAIEEKNKLIDTVVRSKQHLHDTVKALEVRRRASCDACNFNPFHGKQTRARLSHRMTDLRPDQSIKITAPS